MPSSARGAQIAEALAAVHERIDRARAACGRTDPVRSGRGDQDLPRLRRADPRRPRGDRRCGEPRPGGPGQADRSAPSPELRWHMIGQMQRNKAGSVVRWADVVESVDRPELVTALGRRAREAGHVARGAGPGRPRPGVPAGPGWRRSGRRRGRWPRWSRTQAGPATWRGVMGVAPYPGRSRRGLRPAAGESPERSRARWPRRRDRVGGHELGPRAGGRARGDTGPHWGRGTRRQVVRAVTSTHWVRRSGDRTVRDALGSMGTAHTGGRQAMAGAMRKMAVYLGLVEDHGDDAYDEYDEYENARRGAREGRSSGRAPRTTVRTIATTTATPAAASARSPTPARCARSAAMVPRRAARPRRPWPIDGPPDRT